MIAQVAEDKNFAECELVEFDSPKDWAEGRHGSIGSSDGPVVLNKGYAGSSRFSLWGEKSHGITPEFSASQLKLFEKGNIAEPYIAGMCRLEFGWDVQFDPRPSYRRNLIRPFVTASLDAWMIEDGEYVALEFKAINAFSIRSEWDVRSGKAPLKYTIQLQHQMAVTGWKRGYLVAVSGLDIYKIPVERHDRLIEAMLLEYDDFWRLVVEKIPPEIDDSDATRDTIEKVYPFRPMGHFQLDEKQSQLVTEIDGLEKSLKSDERRLSRLRNQLAWGRSVGLSTSSLWAAKCLVSGRPKTDVRGS